MLGKAVVGLAVGSRIGLDVDVFDHVRIDETIVVHFRGLHAFGGQVVLAVPSRPGAALGLDQPCSPFVSEEADGKAAVGMKAGIPGEELARAVPVARTLPFAEQALI